VVANQCNDPTAVTKI